MLNLYTDEEIDRCTMTDRREIIFQLRRLLRQNDWISVSFDEGRHNFLTVLVEISEAENCCYFDLGGSREINEKFLDTKTCQFSSNSDGIRIHFSGASPRSARLKGENVFVVALPQSLVRLQRRDSYRLQLPSSRPYFCHFAGNEPENVALPLYDISVGGFGIQVAQRLSFDPMERLENCQIDLREHGKLNSIVEVRYIMPSETRTHKPIWHMGCRLVSTSVAEETILQRFIARIEAERRSLFET